MFCKKRSAYVNGNSMCIEYLIGGPNFYLRIIILSLP